MSSTRCAIAKWCGHAYHGLLDVDVSRAAVAAEAPPVDIVGSGKLVCPFRNGTPRAK